MSRITRLVRFKIFLRLLQRYELGEALICPKCQRKMILINAHTIIIGKLVYGCRMDNIIESLEELEKGQ